MDLKTTYNRIAEDWATDHAADTWWIEGTDEFCKLLKPGVTILDVGCGAGLKTKYLTDKGFKVTGVDFSENMIKAAQRKYPSLDFKVADIHEIDSVEGDFDAIFVQAVLLHVKKSDVLEVVKKMKSKLNEKGLIYIAVKGIRPGGIEEEIKKENDYGYDYERFFSYFSIEELRDYFKELHMDVVWENVADSGRSNWIQIVGRKV